jgi:hypothetical protein
MSVPTGVWFFASHLLFLAALTATAWALGRTVTRRTSFADPVESFAVSASLGLGLLSWLFFVLGLIGGFHRVTVMAMGMAVWVLWLSWGLRRGAPPLFPEKLERGREVAPSAVAGEGRGEGSGAAGPGREVAPSAVAGEGRGEGFGRGEKGFWAALGFLALLPVLLLPFYPPTVPDSTVYHLPLAEGLVENHRPTFDETLRFPVFPLLDETLFAVAMAFTSDVGAQLVHCLQMLLTALLIVAWGRRLGSRRGGLWAAALWLGTPLVVWMGGAAYVDLGLALFVTAALYTWEVRAPGEARGLWITGAFAGFAAGTKYLGLLFVAGLGLLALVEAARHRRPAVFVALALAAVLALLPFYGWIYAETGSPVFPFYPQLFGDSEWQTDIDRGRTAASELERIATGAVDLLRVPWDAVFHRQRFSHQAPTSPFLILLLPTAGLLALRRPDSRRLLAWTAVYGLFWLTTVRDLRFLLAVLPALAVALMASLDRAFVRRPPPSWATVLAAALLLAPGTVYACVKLGERGPPPTAAAARREYLLEQVPGYAAIAHLNRKHGDSYTVYGLSRPRLHYHADGRFLGSRLGPYEYRKVRSAFGDGRELYRRLTAFGVDYLLYVETPASGTLPRDAAFAELFAEELAGDGFVLYRLAEAG